MGPKSGRFADLDEQTFGALKAQSSRVQGRKSNSPRWLPTGWASRPNAPTSLTAGYCYDDSNQPPEACSLKVD